MSNREIAWALKVPKRMVKQVWKMYRDTGNTPIIGERLGRPRTSVVTEKERQVIKMAKKLYKLGARRLEPVIERDYKYHIPNNKIHKVLLEEGLAREEPKKKKRRKWIRHERKHTLLAVHIDWYDGKNGKKVCFMEDDASRYLLGCGEFDAKTEDNSIALFQKMVQDYWEICPVRELIIDRGSEYGAHRTDEKGDWNSEFKNIVEETGTKIIRIRVNHPQSNGKVEKAFHPYIKYRNEFRTVEDYIYWYNNTRPHESLGTKRSPLETPREAFWCKLPTECLLRRHADCLDSNIITRKSLEKIKMRGNNCRTTHNYKKIDF